MPAEIILHERQQQALKRAFLGWQCRIRQYAMRELAGKPVEGICPEVWLPGDEEALGSIITLIHRGDPYEDTMQLRHIYKKTQDPRERQESALKLFQSTHFQRSGEFGDILTAVFQPGSEGAAIMANAGECRLVFEQQSQRYDLLCEVWPLQESEPLYQASFWHNALFNPGLPAGTQVLAFKPDWARSSAEPEPPNFGA